MNDALFNELLESVREAGQIRRGEKAPSRKFDFSPPDIRAIREQVGLSQSEFATVMGVNLRTLQNWEQGRRKPHGPAVTLLKIVKTDPRRAMEALHA